MLSTGVHQNSDLDQITEALRVMVVCAWLIGHWVGMKSRWLLASGVLAAVAYVGADIIAAVGWQPYSFRSQTVSELMGLGSPWRPFLMAMFSLHNFLVFIFSIAVRHAGGPARRMKVTAALLAVYAVVGEIGLVMAPMHQRGEVASATDTAHIIVTVVLGISILLFIAYGGGTRGKVLFRYSVGSMAVMILFGAWAGRLGPRLAANEPTPWMGIIERINIYSCMAWLAVYALVLAATPTTGKHTPSGDVLK